VEPLLQLVEEIRRLAFGTLDDRKIARPIRDLFLSHDHPEVDE
jgi:hypothetical protein